MKMERTDELAMFRTALEIADLHPDAVGLPDDHQVIVGSSAFTILIGAVLARRSFFSTAAVLTRIPGIASR